VGIYSAAGVSEIMTSIIQNRGNIMEMEEMGGVRRAKGGHRWR